ncbi:hypothetical protein J2W24_002130 [Variovorax boronicumulans]|uniref:hypothetical protein n=1 Tax=Variovorax boronicumulans TaxID=436515 RepID=UPI00278941F5|nr:hypothetical protein [Variovorax boronicumulans]MDP9916485.1 hypothetical protein [Variovorax boronicumulans]
MGIHPPFVQIEAREKGAVRLQIGIDWNWAIRCPNFVQVCAKWKGGPASRTACPINWRSFVQLEMEDAVPSRLVRGKADERPNLVPSLAQQTVEPVFGIIKQVIGWPSVEHAEWHLVTVAYDSAPNHALMRGALSYIDEDHIDMLALGLPVSYFRDPGTPAARKQAYTRAVDLDGQRQVTISKVVVCARSGWVVFTASTATSTASTAVEDE